MEKHVYVWRPPEPQIRIFARAGRDAIERHLDGAGLRTVVVHTTHVPPPALSLVPFRRSPMVSPMTVGTGPHSTSSIRSRADASRTSKATWLSLAAIPRTTRASETG